MAPQKTNMFVSNFTEDSYRGIIITAPNQRIELNYADGEGATSPGSRRTKVGTTILVPDTWYFIVGIIRGPLEMDIYVNCENDGGTYTGAEVG